MTTRNSTSAQLAGERIKKKLTQLTWTMNMASIIGAILFAILSKL